MSKESISSTSVSGICSDDLAHQVAFDSRDPSTPSTSVTTKGGVKRVLFIIKSRPISGVMSIEDKTDPPLTFGGHEGVDEGAGYFSVPFPLDAEGVAAHLKDVMLPEIQKMIEQLIVVQQTASITSIVDNAIDKAVKCINDTLMKEVNVMKEENKKLRADNSDLKKSVEKLTKRVEKLELLAGNSEQYSRRNSIRISGITETQDENNDVIVSKLRSDLGHTDIDRSHRSGRVRRNRTILVRFATYNDRYGVFSKG